MADKYTPWWSLQVRQKPDKVVVKIHNYDNSYLDSINIPTVMWPLNGKYELFHRDNCQLITDETVKQLTDGVDYSIGHCYYNAQLVTQALTDAGYDAKQYVGWMFISGNQYPIHHSWTVLDGVHVIDLADDMALKNGNWEKLTSGKTEKDARELLVDFTKWAMQYPHSQRCMPFGIPAPQLFYVGCECSRNEGIQIYNTLTDVYPNHPCRKNVRPSGMTDMQERLLKAGLK